MDHFNERGGKKINFWLDHLFNLQEDASDLEITEFLNGSKAKQTCYKEKSDVKRLMAFIKESNGETRELQDYLPMELDKLMCAFFMTAKKYNKKVKNTMVTFTNRTH